MDGEGKDDGERAGENMGKEGKGTEAGKGKVRRADEGAGR